MRSSTFFRRLGLIGFACAALARAEVRPALLQPPPEVEPFAALAAFAAAHDVPVSGFEPAPENETRAVAGDAVTALVVLHRGKDEAQWLLQLQIAPPTQKELAENPPTKLRLNVPSGRVLSFVATTGLGIDIRAIGPVIRGRTGDPVEKRSRALVSEDFLAIGLDRSCQTFLRLSAEKRAQSATVPQDKATPSPPFSEADERAIAGFAPALMALLQAIQSTPGLREILWEVLEKPSLWSFVKRAGKTQIGLDLDGNNTVGALAPAAMPAAPIAYRMSPTLTINDKPGLLCSLFVASPRPPLLTTAGVLGIVAIAPTKPDLRLDIRVVASRRGHAQ